jgi:uncharacterized protein (TIGR02722 family)
MKKTSLLLTLTAAAALTLSGCASGIQNIDPETNAVLPSNGPESAGLTQQDFLRVAKKMVDSIESEAFRTRRLKAKKYELPLLTHGEIVNKTEISRLDTRKFLNAVESELIRRGLAEFTTAADTSGSADGAKQSLGASRDLRGDAEVNQASTIAQGKILSAEYSISGSISQANTSLSGGQLQSEYSFQLQINDLSTARKIWVSNTNEKGFTVVKRGDRTEMYKAF